LVALADGRTASGQFVVNATGGRSGIEQPLGMGLTYHGDWSWFGAARTSHAPQLEDGVRAGGFLGLVRNDKPDRFGDLRPAFDKLDRPTELEQWRGSQ